MHGLFYANALSMLRLLRPINGLAVVSSKMSAAVVRIMAAQAALFRLSKRLSVVCLAEFWTLQPSMFGLPVRLRQRTLGRQPRLRCYTCDAAAAIVIMLHVHLGQASVEAQWR